MKYSIKDDSNLKIEKIFKPLPRENNKVRIKVSKVKNLKRLKEIANATFKSI